MKLIFASLLLLLLASCGQYRYDITYEKCNGQTGSYTEIREYDPTYYAEYRQLKSNKWFINNVCDFSYNRNEIK